MPGIKTGFGVVLLAALAFSNVSNADQGWSKFSPNHSGTGPAVVYVTSELLCDGCAPKQFPASDKLPKDTTAAARLWISLPAQPEYGFWNPANSLAGIAMLGAEGDILSFVDEPQISRLSSSLRSHVESAPLNSLSAAQRVKLSELHYSGFDPANGGTRKLNKTISPTLLYSISAALQEDQKEERMAKITLDSSLALRDQVWGGVFDGGLNGAWTKINYQKSTVSQGEALYAYSLGFRHFRDEHYLNAARSVVDFIRTFLVNSDGSVISGILAPQPNAAAYFALSDSGRRTAGAPVVVSGPSIVGSGKVLVGLAELYPFMPDDELQALIQRLAGWLKHVRAESITGLYEITWGVRGLLAAYEVLGDRDALLAAIKFAERAEIFVSPGGFASILNSSGASQRVLVGTNSLNSIQFADAMIRLHHLTGKGEFLNSAKQALGSAVDMIDGDPDAAASALNVDSELTSLPAHLTVVGPRADPATKALFLEALRVPSAFRRVELWDKSEGGLVNPDVKYPELSKPAAFICTEKRCSLPIFAAEKIPELWNRLKKTSK